VEIADGRTAPAPYRAAMTELGRLLGEDIASRFSLHETTVCVAFTVEDADFLARGTIAAIEAAGAHASLACFWNRRDKPYEIDWLDIAPIVQEYVEPLPAKLKHLIVLKSIISGTCVVRTNLLRLLDEARPEMVHILAPVMLQGAEERLAKSLSPELVAGFDFVSFAIDTEVTAEGIIRPGIGGEIYERLGLGGIDKKNAVMPSLVEERLGRSAA
jgi:uracil phosphoribosyltransferase